MQRFNTTSESWDEVVSVDEEVDLHEKAAGDMVMLEQALGKLGEPCKSLLESFYLQKKSMPEIAEFFGYTNADNAKTQKYKCLVRLKKIFFAQYKNGG